MEFIYDVIIIGGGPGGYTAALYATRAGFTTLVIEKMSVGGQMTETMQIDNYPGFNEGIDGFSLGDKMKSGAEKFGAKTEFCEVLSVDLKEKIKKIETSNGTFLAKTVVIATGAEHRRLGIADEEKFRGRGLGYCATCDGGFFRGKTVAVVGGGNSAVSEAVFLSRICKKVYIVHRRDTLRATRVYHSQLEKADNIEFIWDSSVDSLLGEDKLRIAKIKNLKTGEISELGLDGIFISIGRNPVTELFKEQLKLDTGGYIEADESTKTNIPGVFAVGDVRTKAVRQIVTAAADGAVAAHFIEEYLS